MLNPCPAKSACVVQAACAGSDRGGASGGEDQAWGREGLHSQRAERERRKAGEGGLEGARGQQAAMCHT